MRHSRQLITGLLISACLASRRGAMAGDLPPTTAPAAPATSCAWHVRLAGVPTTLHAATPVEISAGPAWSTPPAPALLDRVIYVDSVNGVDGRAGTSPALAIKTLAGAKAFKPTRLLLACGSSWAEELNGISGAPTRPAYIGDYGSGPRPVIIGMKGHNAAGFICRQHDLLIQGITFTGSFMGLCLRDVANVVVEDCETTGNNYGINIDADGAGHDANITLRGCMSHDNFPTDGKQSEGLFIGSVDGVLVEDCTLDRNGWRPGLRQASPGFKNHDVYVHEEVTGLIFRRNVVSRGCQFGLNDRAGGTIADNAFVNNPIAIYTESMTSDVTGNLITGDQPTAGGMELNAKGQPERVGWPVRFCAASGSVIGNWCGPQPNQYEPMIEVCPILVGNAAAPATQPQMVAIANNTVWGVLGKAYNRQTNRTTIDDANATTTLAMPPTIDVSDDWLAAATRQRRTGWDARHTAAALIHLASGQ